MNCLGLIMHNTTTCSEVLGLIPDTGMIVPKLYYERFSNIRIVAVRKTHRLVLNVSY